MKHTQGFKDEYINNWWTISIFQSSFIFCWHHLFTFCPFSWRTWSLFTLRNSFIRKFSNRNNDFKHLKVFERERETGEGGFFLKKKFQIRGREDKFSTEMGWHRCTREKGGVYMEITPVLMHSLICNVKCDDLREWIIFLSVDWLWLPRSVLTSLFLRPIFHVCIPTKVIKMNLLKHT